MKKNLLFTGLAMALLLPLSSFKSETQTLNKATVKTSKFNLVFKKNFTEVEFGDVPAGVDLSNVPVFYGIYGDYGTTNITDVRNIFTGNPPMSYTITYWDGALISISGINEYGLPFDYSGHLVWA